MIALDKARAQIVAGLDKMWPGIKDEIEDVEFYRYHPRAIAAWPVGRSRFDDLSNEIRRSENHVYLAGDFTESSHSDGAFISAHRAVKSILELRSAKTPQGKATHMMSPLVWLTPTLLALCSTEWARLRQKKWISEVPPARFGFISSPPKPRESRIFLYPGASRSVCCERNSVLHGWDRGVYSRWSRLDSLFPIDRGGADHNCGHALSRPIRH